MKGLDTRVVELILSTKEFLVENSREALSALQAYREHKPKSWMRGDRKL